MDYKLKNNMKGINQMKKITAVFFTAFVFLFIGCKGPEGPAGPAGDTGKDGKDAGFIYFEGFKENLKCGTCHTPDNDTALYVNARRLQYQTAGHITGTGWGRNTTTCAGCHTTEGFLDRAKGGFISQLLGKNYLNSTPPNCFTCHSPHLRGNFTMRDTNSVKIKSFVATAPDLTVNMGQSNMCLKCHATRETSPMTPVPDPTKTAATDSIVITSSRFYPHYGVQGQMLLGKGGFEFAGYTYPSSPHTSLALGKNIQCSNCHMAEPQVIVEGKSVAGGHTLKIGYFSSLTDTVGSLNVAGCRTSGCHADITANTMTRTNFKNYRTAQKDVSTGLDTLKALLIKKGWLVSSTLLANASTSKPLVIKPAYKAGALFNFFFIEHEGSHGIHNTKYAKAVLDASIAELKN